MDDGKDEDDDEHERLEELRGEWEEMPELASVTQSSEEGSEVDPEEDSDEDSEGEEEELKKSQEELYKRFQERKKKRLRRMRGG